jgi:hypothetical protein
VGSQRSTLHALPSSQRVSSGVKVQAVARVSLVHVKWSSQSPASEVPASQVPVPAQIPPPHTSPLVQPIPSSHVSPLVDGREQETVPLRGMSAHAPLAHWKSWHVWKAVPPTAQALPNEHGPIASQLEAMQVLPVVTRVHAVVSVPSADSQAPDALHVNVSTVRVWVPDSAHSFVPNAHAE